LLVWYIWRRRKRRRKAKAEAEAARLKEIADKKQQKETEHIVNKTQLAMTRKMLEIQPP
jgi:type VI protein secretion system component VasK